jgi:hypothetical protein
VPIGPASKAQSGKKIKKIIREEPTGAGAEVETSVQSIQGGHNNFNHQGSDSKSEPC